MYHHEERITDDDDEKEDVGRGDSNEDDEGADCVSDNDRDVQITLIKLSGKPASPDTFLLPVFPIRLSVANSSTTLRTTIGSRGET